jgi:hypothetical protein
MAIDYAWPPTNRPGAGAWWSMAWDAKRKRVWLSGGSGLVARKHPELMHDLWHYDPARNTFEAAGSKGFPGFSGGSRIVYDSRNDLVLRAPAYGGEWASRHNQDRTWVYDPEKNAWEGRATPGTPRNALAAVWVFDPHAGKAVYLAQAKDQPSETWTYDAASNTWERIETRECPPARVAAGAAYDPDHRQVVICGGVGGNDGGNGFLYRGGGVQLTDTWALDLAAREWKKLDVGMPVVPALPGQPSRGRFELFCALDYDTRNKAFVLSAPTMGVWALRRREADATPLPELKLAALPSLPASQPPAGPVFLRAAPNPKLLNLPPLVWTRLDGGPSIGGGEVPMTYDEATGFCLKYGGCNNGGAGTFSSGYGNDLSAYDPATERWLALRWVDPCGPPRPANGCTRVYAYDPVRKVTWFAGGTSGNYLASSLPPGITGGTWRYDGLNDRFELIPSTGKQPSPGVICGFDRANNLFLAAPAQTWSVPHVCLFNPVTGEWTAGGATPSYPYTFGCYVDSLKSLMAVKTDKDTGAVRTMAYDAAVQTWKDLAPKGDCPYEAGRQTLAYDPGHDVVLCVLSGKTYLYRVQENTWKKLDIETPKVNEQMVFDRRHHAFLATGAMGSHMWALRTGDIP